MEDHRVSALVAFTAALLGVMAGSAQAYERDVQAGSNRNGVEVVLSRRDGTGPIVLEGRPDQPNRPSTGSCDYHLIPYPFDPGTPRGGYPPSPNHYRSIVLCDGVYVGTAWIGPSLEGTGTLVIDGRAVAERLIREIPIGEVTIGRRPADRGITGIPSLFWVEGYGGQPIERSIVELGSTVDVRISLAAAEWEFGDGTATDEAGLGQRWPARSTVSHVYLRSSAVGRPYRVSVRISFAAMFRVDGGAWQALSPLQRSATTSYDVNQVQAIRGR